MSYRATMVVGVLISMLAAFLASYSLVDAIAQDAPHWAIKGLIALVVGLVVLSALIVGAGFAIDRIFSILSNNAKD